MPNNQEIIALNRKGYDELFRLAARVERLESRPQQRVRTRFRMTPDELSYCEAQSDWEENGGDPRVKVKACDKRTAPTSEGDEFWLYLPRVGGLDPNVHYGDVLGYMLDQNGDAVAVTDYLDDKVGTIKAWNLPTADIPAGWEELTDAGGRSIYGWVNGDPTFGTIGAKTGIDVCVLSLAPPIVYTLNPGYVAPWIIRVP